MTPKVDTINLSYFVPGAVVVASAFYLVRGIYPGAFSWQEGSATAVAAAIFLALAYIAGYLCWWAGDTIRQKWSDRIIFDWLLKYVCWEKPLLACYVQILRETGHTQLAGFLCDVATCKGYGDDIEGMPCDDLEHDVDGKKIEQYGRRLRLVTWDLAYSRSNPYFVGRFLSSWNNVKFVKSTGVGLVASGVFFFARGIADAVSCSWLSPSQLIWPVLVLTGVLLWGRPLKWRLRVYARDLAHALAPSYPKQQTGRGGGEDDCVTSSSG